MSHVFRSRESQNAIDRGKDSYGTRHNVKYRAIKQSGGGYALAWRDSKGFHTEMLPVYITSRNDVQEWFDDLKESGDTIEIG